MRSRTFVGAILLSFTLIPRAGAVCPDPPVESPLAMGEVGLFFDAAGTVSCANPPVAVPTPLYLVARAPEGGIGSYGIPWLEATRLPSGLVFVTDTLDLPASSRFELGQTADWCHQALPREAGCAVAAGELVVLGVTTIQPVGPLAGTAQFQTRCPTFAGVRPEPVHYEACGSAELRTLEGGDHLAIGFGEAPVAAVPESWSTLKSRFPSP
jgi:hypothetical protein